MQALRKILFVSQALADETEAMKQALSMARNHAAELDGLIVCPQLPGRSAVQTA